MDQEIRNKLRSVVTQCRNLLEDSILQELEGKYGIFAKNDQVTADPNAPMSQLTAEEQTARKDILDHLDHIKVRGFMPKDALSQLVREIAFTHLNRLCAYKMMEARGVYIGGQKFREAVSRGVNSNGVKFYLADHPDDERLFNTGQQDIAYRRFLDWLGGLLSEEIGVLFNPNDPANRLYPRQKTLDEVLTLLNEGDIKPDEIELRQQWPTIWSQDETIGWVYQYFTPKEVRDDVRASSRMPRDSYELAFLNQFFTPRYVVEYLTDNTLGRIWYEMRKGHTTLKSCCRFMVRRLTESFLDDGEMAPQIEIEPEEDSQAERLKQPIFIPHRAKKDPRELKILDPASGSGHFLLYCFDLLLVIYEEAYTDPDLGPALRRDYPDLAAFRQEVPRLILAHNLHGIDIDLRASQIAALALWLRCQRAYGEMGLKGGRRKITRSNFVCAEPMPGEAHLLKEFVSQLEPKLLGQLVEVVFQKMKLAGEAGSLLRIEEEIRSNVAEAKAQWQVGPKQEQMLLFGTKPRPVEQLAFDFSGVSDSQFFEQAESRVVETLSAYSQRASNGHGLRRQLFREDAVRGFSFIDLCHKRFDVVLMNPPFGACSSGGEKYIAINYPSTKADILASFVERGLALCTTDGRLGAITSRTCFFLGNLAGFRQDVLGHHGFIESLVDMGEGVLDATVETAMYVLSRNAAASTEAVFIRSLLPPDKQAHILGRLATVAGGTTDTCVFLVQPGTFSLLSGSPHCYWIAPATRAKLARLPVLEGNVGTVRVGLQTSDDFRFLRLIWEVPASWIAPSPAIGTETTGAALRTECLKELSAGKRWAFYSKTDEARPWLSPLTLLVDWENGGERIKTYARQQGNSPSRSVRSEDRYFEPGFSYMLRSVRITPYLVPGGVIPTAGRAQVFPLKDRIGLMGVLSSNVASAVARFRGEKFAWPKFQASIIQELPVAEIPCSTATKIEAMIESHIARSRLACEGQEPLPEFRIPSVDAEATALPDWNLLSFLGEDVEQEVAAAFGLDAKEYGELERDISDALSLGTSDKEDDDESSEEELASPEWRRAEQIVSYCIGAVFGRWDVRFVMQPHLLPASQGAFDRMPVCPPGSLVSPDGLPARSNEIVSEKWLQARPNAVVLPQLDKIDGSVIRDDQYPLPVKWDGILVDDEQNSDDLIRRMRGAMEMCWGGRSEELERFACKTFGVESMRGYVRKMGKDGFWQDHLKRYSVKRSRKAPLYWCLQTSKKNYAIWLFYHRLDKDMLFKALVNYVEPKIRLESARLDSLRAEKAAAGDAGKKAKQLAKKMQEQDDLVAELREFEDKLRSVAQLNFVPDLSDGVVLNAAPLHQLITWKEAKTYWDDLLKGEYEWSSIGRQLRQKGLVK